MISVKVQKCKNEEDTLLFLVVDKDGTELLKSPIYIDSEAAKKMPSLRQAETDLLSILKMAYESGLAREKINFIEEDISLDV